MKYLVIIEMIIMGFFVYFFDLLGCVVIGKMK